DNADAETLERAQRTFRKIAETVVPVVVSINVNDIAASGSPWDFFFQDPEEDEGIPKERDFERYGMGSGVIVERQENNYFVLTNHHVIKGGKEIKIVLADKREFTARIAGIDERKDMALLSFESKEELPVARLGIPIRFAWAIG
ncbi:MAG TPA: hypothetical protein ENN69_00995, partial [Spirochaetia bacterium]|nr:hypothetical protein [Spirochaetia bacterium]